MFPPWQLSNGDFEQPFASVAPGWYQNTWSSSPPAVVTWAEEMAPLHVHGGLRSQRIAVTSLGNGGTLFAQAHAFPAGDIYSASVWLKADGGRLRSSGGWLPV